MQGGKEGEGKWKEIKGEWKGKARQGGKEGNGKRQGKGNGKEEEEKRKK